MLGICGVAIHHELSHQTTFYFPIMYNISSLHKLCCSFVFSSGYKGLMQVNLIFRNAKLQSSRQNTGKSVVLRSFFYSLIHELSTLTLNKTFTSYKIIFLMNKNTRMGKKWLLHLITTKRPSTVVVKNRIFQDLFSFQSGCYGGTTLSSCSMGRHKLYWQKVILQNKLPNSSTHRLCDPGGKIIRFIIFRKGFKNNKGIFYRSPHNKSFMENVVFLTKTTLKENSKKKFNFFENFPLTSCPFSSFQFFKFTCKLLIIYYSWLRLRERSADHN